ncbi:MAG TPA: hypothetical protein VNH17_18045, partial [Streptosporangiaceae bacterium]|nr:hypothetical protein [Streptosporangiaceae bacterium]
MTDQDPEYEDVIEQGRPAWAGERKAVPPGPPAPRLSQRLGAGRSPVSGRQEDDGLWTHAAETGALAVAATWIAALVIPATVPLWMLYTGGAALTAVAWLAVLSHTGSLSVAHYLGTWGLVLTGWLTAARIIGPWHSTVIYSLLLPALVLIVAGPVVIRRHRDRVRQAAEIGRDTANSREVTYWSGLLQLLGVSGVTVRDVHRMNGGKQVHCRLGKYTADGRRPTGIEGIRELAGPLAQHLRLGKGAIYIEEDPAGGTYADFTIHVRTVTGPRLTRYLPAGNGFLSITRPFGLGVFDNGREFRLRLREVRVFICGLIGSGKSTLLNVFLAQLCRMPDALIFMIDLKGGQEAMAWLLPFLD